MARRDQISSSSPNPAKYRLEWDSNEKRLRFWDTEKSENVPVKLPFKFLVIQRMHTVGGYSDAYNSGVYANEVEDISSQELTVKTFKGGYEKKGLYVEIKETIQKDIDAKYVQSIYLMTSKGDLLNLRLQGAAYSEWLEFGKKSQKRLFDEWVTITGAKEGKKGSVTYSVPVFEFSGSLDSESDKKAEELYDQVKAYIDRSPSATVPADNNKPVVADQEEEDDLPF